MTTIDKALDALFLLGESHGSLRLSDIAEQLKMPRSSAHRILKPLVGRDLVEQDASGRYRTGLALMSLGLGVGAREPLALAARPILEAAADEVGETFFLVVARAKKLIVIEKAEGHGFMRAAPRLGSQVPVHATAVGHLYLAHDPQAIELGPLERFTETTPTKRKALDRCIEQAREQGWAVNDQSWQAGLSVVAAPIFAQQRLAGAVAIAMVAQRFRQLGQKATLRRVQHAAEGIALRLEGNEA